MSKWRIQNTLQRESVGIVYLLMYYGVSFAGFDNN